MLKVRLLRKTNLKQTQKPLSNYDLDDNSNLIINDEVTLYYNRRNNDFGKIVHEDDNTPLSDYVMTRLAGARALALAAYRKQTQA